MRNAIVEEDLKFIAEAGVPWGSLEGKTILISGAAGFVPAYMVETILYLNETLFKDKAKILAIVRNKERALSRFAFYKSRTELKFIQQDVCDPVSIKEPVDFVVHAASHASPKYFGSDPVGTLSPNVIGTRNLLEFSRKKKVKLFLFFSSGEVYGQPRQEETLTNENNYGYVNPVDTRSCYAESKRMGENMCVAWHSQYGVPAKIARLFHTFGPGLRLDDGRVFADFVSDIVNGRNIVMKSDGSAIRCFCYLADAVVGLFTVMLKGSNGEAYNVGNDKGSISVLDLAKMLVEAFPKKALKVEMKGASEQKGYLRSNISVVRPDITKIGKLGWSPKHSLKDGFIRTVRSF
jgi:nucleoside-diphosphate-sugar epimerase